MAGFLVSAGVYVGGDTELPPVGAPGHRPWLHFLSVEELQSPQVVSPLSCMNDLPLQLPPGHRPWMSPATDWPIGGPEVMVPQVVSPLSWTSDISLPPGLAFLSLSRNRQYLDSATLYNFPWAAIVPSPVTGTGPYFGTVPVPSAPGYGAALSVGVMGPKKTLMATGLASGLGNVYVEGSMDGSRYVTIWDPNTGASTAYTTISGLWAYLRTRREGGSGGSIFIDVGGGASSSS